MTISEDKPRPSVSIVVPHYEDFGGLDRCLAALQAQTYPQDLVEIVVADNLSPSGRERVEAVIAGRARLALVPERGAGPARNGGVAASTGEILAFTDADCVPERGWLDAVVTALESADAIGGRMVVLHGQPINPIEAFELIFAFDNERYVTRMGFTVTANLACRREVFEKVGGFRVGVSEDLDWSHRATAEGFRLAYARDAVVGHPARTSWPDLIKKWRRINAETYGLSAGRSGRRLRWLARASLLPVSAIAHSPKVLRRSDLSLQERLGALAVLYRHRFWRLLDALRIAASSGAG